MTDPVQHDKWRDGDFHLISSDRIKFSVPSYHLQSAS